MAILGLTSTKTFKDQEFFSLNDRRTVFREFPNGSAPLTGLLSLADNEPTDNPEFGWFEKRYTQLVTNTRNVGSGVGPFQLTGATGPVTDGGTLTAGLIYRLNVVSNADIRESDTIYIENWPRNTGTGIHRIRGVVTLRVSTDAIEFRCVGTYTNIDNDASSPARRVRVMGSAYAEGSTSGKGRLVVPVNPANYCQIFKTAFSFTLTSLKVPAVFDKGGIYPEKAKDNAIEHMTAMERWFLFGAKQEDVVDTPDSEQVIERKTGGLLWWLEQWDKGHTGSPNNGAYNYRPGGADLTDADWTLAANEEKRVIRNLDAGGAITKSQFDELLRRAFVRTNNRSFEKIAFCGSLFLKAVNDCYENFSTTFKHYPAEEAYGMDLVTLVTPFGTLHLKQHPLMTLDPTWQASCFIVDVHNLRYRYLTDRDTRLYTHREGNDDDRRKDAWITEAGLEVNYPESHMFIENVQSITTT